jgi:3-oxoacyl-[acyl-carrier protein] reductase
MTEIATDRLEGRIALVTGAGSPDGIGYAIARRLVALGASVGVVSTTKRIHDRATELDAIGYVADLTDPAEVEALADAVRDGQGDVDVLVNNAGLASVASPEVLKPVAQLTDDDWRTEIDRNLTTAFLTSRAFITGMAERGWGRVVNVSSTAGKRPSALMPEYSVAKAAQLSLSRLYADRCAADGVLVNAICPGPTKSELWVGEGGLADQSAAMAGDDPAAALERAGGGRPIKRLAAVEEIAAAIVFLCSERASYVAGAAWSVDGGTVPVII